VVGRKGFIRLDAERVSDRGENRQGFRVRFVASHLAYARDGYSLRRMEHKHRGQDGGLNVFIGQGKGNWQGRGTIFEGRAGRGGMWGMV
jgi:hypothetical protein